ncbi:MAG: flagellar biosynthesis repressor FlbT [Alphaproteobacteria bacterium]
MALKIRLKPKEKMVVNGAVLAAGDQSVVLYFLNNARILLEKDILTENRVIGPESTLYYLVQLMYIDPESQPRYADFLPGVLEELLEKYPKYSEDLDKLVQMLVGGEHYKALRLCKALFDIQNRTHEEEAISGE